MFTENLPTRYDQCQPSPLEHFLTARKYADDCFPGHCVFDVIGIVAPLRTRTSTREECLCNRRLITVELEKLKCRWDDDWEGTCEGCTVTLDWVT